MTTTGFVCGAFDLLHAGHCLLLEACKRNCDYLIVGLHDDPSLERKEKNTPVQSLFERWIQLHQNKHVDLIIPYSTEDELLQILMNFEINLRFLGSDYQNCDESYITGNDLEPEIVIIERKHNYSSSELRNRIAEYDKSDRALRKAATDYKNIAKRTHEEDYIL